MSQTNKDNSGNWQNSPLTPKEYRKRQDLLTKVKNFWVKGVLEKSFHNQALIELGLEESPDTVAYLGNIILETEDFLPRPLTEAIKVIDIFKGNNTEESLLILGEPGLGKTTTLLQLAQDLISRAEQDINLPIPVVFNLSAWNNKPQKIEDWLIEELATKYDVPQAISKTWLKKQQILPLLDGLDEVEVDYRDNCIAALNQFKQDYVTGLV
ncbi:MAG: NACHT domain-containing protein, partial [Spirulinaceae cyanobacterium]